MKRTASVLRTEGGAVSKAFLDIDRMVRSSSEQSAGVLSRFRSAVGSSMTAAAKSTRELSAEVSVLKENLGKTLSQQKILKDFQEVRSQIEAAAAEVDKAQKDLLNLQKSAAQNKVGIDKGALAKKQTAENEAIEKRNRLLEKQDKIISIARRYNVELDKAAESTRRLTNQERTLRAEIEKRERLVSRRNMLSRGFKEGVSEAAGLSIVSDSLQRTSQGIYQRAQSIYGMGGTLEKSIADAAAAGFADKSDAERQNAIPTVRGIVMNAQAGTSLLPSALAAISQELLKAGDDIESLKGEQGRRNLQTLGKLSVVGELAPGQTADLATTVKNIFQEKDYKYVSDVLTNVANLTKTNLSEVAEAMKYMAVDAKKAGLSFTDTAGVIATLAQGAIRGTTAGTSARMGLLRLFAPDKGASDMMQAMKLQLIDKATGKARPIESILADVGTAIKPLNDQQQIAVLKEIFGVEASSAMKILVEKASTIDARTGKSMLAGAFDSAARPGDATDRYFDISQQTTEAKIRKLRGSMEKFSLTVLDRFAPTLTTIIDRLTVFVNRAADFVDQNPGVVKAIAVLGATTMAMGTAIASASKLIIANSIVKAVTGRSIVNLLGGLFLRFAPALGPWGLAIGAVLAAAVGGYMLYDKLKTPSTTIDSEKAKAEEEKKRTGQMAFPQINNYTTISAPGVNQDQWAQDVTKKMNESIEKYMRDSRFVYGVPGQ
jgi:TP901 family phage tail tape measure protein